MPILQLFHEQLEEAILLGIVEFRPTHVFRELAVAHLLHLLVYTLNAAMEGGASEESLDHLALREWVRNHRKCFGTRDTYLHQRQEGTESRGHDRERQLRYP
jgi:hypothetical protein